LNYVEAFLLARHCDALQQIKCGVPQGDPLSMMMFCLGIEPILKFLDQRKIEFVCYADDIVI